MPLATSFNPFEQAAIITVDGVGEWATTTYGVGEGNKVRIPANQFSPFLYTLLGIYLFYRIQSEQRQYS